MGSMRDARAEMLGAMVFDEVRDLGLDEGEGGSAGAAADEVRADVRRLVAEAAGKAAS